MDNYSLRASFLSLYNGKSSEEKSRTKKGAANYEPKVKTDLFFDELIAMSIGETQEKKEEKK